MPVCERCQYDNPPGRDFCAECGYYVRWEPTAERPAVPVRTPTQRQPVVRAGAPAPPRRRRDRRGGVTLALALPGEPPGADRVEVTAEAGGEACIAALVRNRGELGDHYAIPGAAVPGSWGTGVPEIWWTCEPPAVRLVPPSAAGGYEQTVEVRLHPPRAPRARAGSG